MENSAKARNDDYNAAEKIIMAKAPIAPIYQYTNGRLIAVLKGYPITNPKMWPTAVPCISLNTDAYWPPAQAGSHC